MMQQNLIGENGLIPQMIEKLENAKKEFETTVVRFAIIGMSGCGKSSLINAISGEKIAKVGVIETTTEPKEYPHGGLLFVDLPGCGTLKWPKDTYVQDLKLHNYDCFVLVTANRFYENDIFLYDQITNSLKKDCFVVYNKFDKTLEDGKHDNGFSEDELRQQVSSNIHGQLKPNDVKKIYLTSARHPKLYDLPMLLEDVMHSLHGVKRNRFVADMASWSESAFREKREVAEYYVGIYAGLAAANGLNPIPGLDVSLDVGLLVKLSSQVSHIYGLTEKQSSYSFEYIKNANPAFQGLKQKITVYVSRYLIKDGIVTILKRLGARAAVKTVSKWIPFVGPLVSAAIGFKMTYRFGEDLIDESEQISKEVFQCMDWDGC